MPNGTFVFPNRLAHFALAGVLMAFSVGLLSGCGRKVSDVSGTVTYKSKLVTSGTVTMVGADDAFVQGEIKEDGSYVLKAVPVGEVKVLVSSPPLLPQKGGKKLDRVDPDTGKKYDSKQSEINTLATQLQKDTWRPIPIRYSDITQTDLKFTVTAGGINTHEIKLAAK